MLLLLFPDTVKVGGVQVVGRYWRSLKTSGSCERLDPVSTVPQDDAERILPGGVPEEDLSDAGRAAGRLGSLGAGVQRAALPPGTLVLRQNAVADVRGQCALGEGENASSLNSGGLAVCQMKS